MPANSTHLDYNAALPAWLRARDVIAGDDAVKAAGESYLPRLDSQNDDEYLAYKTRACFFNATSRTCDGFLGLLFRRDPEVKLPDRHAGVGGALRVFTDDVDLMGTSLFTFCKGVVGEVLAVGRCGTLIDWQGGSATGQSGESRAYVVRYAAEDIINWQMQRINGRNVVTLVALREVVAKPDAEDPFALEQTETIRVLKLESLPDGGTRYVVEIWQEQKSANYRRKKSEWKLVESRVPLRIGKPLPLIPFVFHGPRNALPDVDKMPLADIITVNLDHYRLDADYKHGLHFTALPTAWVAGFDKKDDLHIGSSTAWVAVTEHEETRAKTELGADQKDTARELSAKLASLKGIVWVGLAVFLFGLATMFYPPLKLIIGSVTTSAAITAGGLALMVLPTLVVGNELLILAGVAAAVGLWFLAHRHGQLRGLVDANKNGIDDRLENSVTKEAT